MMVVDGVAMDGVGVGTKPYRAFPIEMIGVGLRSTLIQLVTWHIHLYQNNSAHPYDVNS